MADVTFEKVKANKEQATEKSALYAASFEEPYNPNNLYRKRGDYSYYDECLADEVVNSVLEYKKNLILGNDYYVDSPDDKVREFWDVALNYELEGDIMQMLKNMLSCIDYGFSISEPIYKAIESDGKPRWGLKAIKVRPAHSFYFHTDEYGNIKNLEQSNDKGARVDLKPCDFIIMTYRPKFSNPYGQSDLTEGVYRAVFAKKIIMKFLNIALERFAMPLSIGKVPSSTTDAEVTAMLNILKNLSAKSGAVLKEGYDITFQDAKSGITTAYTEALTYYNLTIARAMGISDLMGISGQQMSSGGLGGGLGDVQYTVMMELFRRIRKQLMRLINIRIIKPLTELNFGRDAYAEFKLVDLSKAEEIQALEMFLKYLEKGGRLRPEQEAWYLEKIGAPVVDTEEEAEEVEKAEDLETPPAPTEQPLDEPTVEEVEVTETKVEESFAARKDTPYEKKVNFQEIERGLDETEQKQLKELEAAIGLVIGNIYDFLKDKKVIENKKFELFKSYKLKGTSGITAVLDQYFTQAFKDGKQTIRKEAKENFAATDEDLAATQATTEIINQWKKSKILWLTKKVTDDMVNTMEPIILDAMKNGAGTRETIKLLSKALETKLDKSQLERIVRTNTMSAYNQGRLQGVKTAPGLIGMQWSAVLDDRTSDICRSLDGKVFKPDEINDYPMPAHPNCRSVWVPVFEEETEGMSNKEIFGDKPNVVNKGGFINLA